MSGLKFAAIITLSTAILTIGFSEAQAHHRHHRNHVNRDHANHLPYPISFLHNYGPGPTPGTIRYYDGRSKHCYQSSAAYVGQDKRKYPCS